MPLCGELTQRPGPGHKCQAVWSHNWFIRLDWIGYWIRSDKIELKKSGFRIDVNFEFRVNSNGSNPCAPFHSYVNHVYFPEEFPFNSQHSILPISFYEYFLIQGKKNKTFQYQVIDHFFKELCSGHILLATSKTWIIKEWLLTPNPIYIFIRPVNNTFQYEKFSPEKNSHTHFVHLIVDFPVADLKTKHCAINSNQFNI